MQAAHPRSGREQFLEQARVPLLCGVVERRARVGLSSLPRDAQAISAFYAAVRGGRMFAEGLFALMEEHGLFTDAKGLPKLPCFKGGWSPEESTLDEAAARSGSGAKA